MNLNVPGCIAARDIFVSPYLHPKCDRADDLLNDRDLFRSKELHIKLDEHKGADQHRVKRKQTHS